MIKSDNWVFIHIPKTSGTNFQKYILSQNGARDCHSFYSRHFTHQPLWWWEEKEDIKDLQTITIVRNPYSRFLSLYNHLSNNVSGLEDFETFLRNKPFQKINKMIEDEVSVRWKKEISYDLFWPQYKFLEGSKKVKVFKHEEDLKELETFVNYNFTNTNYNTRQYERNLKSRYNDYTTSVIDELYKEDFIKFGYKNEL
ncbi:MAG: hypothetical protein RLZZ337_1522 [Bacteroidota bacterium]|jgi:hypothetical protein